MRVVRVHVVEQQAGGVFSLAAPSASRRARRARRRRSPGIREARAPSGRAGTAEQAAPACSATTSAPRARGCRAARSCRRRRRSSSRFKCPQRVLRLRDVLPGQREGRDGAVGPEDLGRPAECRRTPTASSTGWSRRRRGACRSDRRTGDTCSAPLRLAPPWGRSPDHRTRRTWCAGPHRHRPR